MDEYTPDRWVVLTITTDTETIDKVFAGWHGGYAGGDEWKLSSGIVEITEHDSYFEFINHSGSVYTCYKNQYGMSGYMHSVLAQWLNKAAKTPGYTIVVKNEE